MEINSGGSLFSPEPSVANPELMRFTRAPLPVRRINLDASVINVIARTSVGGAAFIYILYGDLSAAVRDGTIQAQERRSTMKRSAG